VSDVSPDVLVREAREFFARKFPDIPEHAGCLFLAVSMIEVARRHGRRLVLQAGTASWRRVRPDQDDGVSATHFSYEWEPWSEQTHQRIADGLLPEMHVWVADPETQEMIDISSKYFPRQCMEMLGVDWPGDLPPDYLWMKAGTVQESCRYIPYEEATIVAMQFFAHYMREVL